MPTSQPPPPRDCVTNAEFSRWITDENAYRARVAQQLEVQYTHISAELTEIKGLVRETNGRLIKAEKTVAVIERDLEAIKSEDKSIEETVEDIKNHGCNQLENHSQVLNELGWSKQKKAAVAGGLLGAGAVIWPALQEVAKLIHTLLDGAAR